MYPNLSIFSTTICFFLYNVNFLRISSMGAYTHYSHPPSAPPTPPIPHSPPPPYVGPLLYSLLFYTHTLLSSVSGACMYMCLALTT